jgi:GNAT superfamily N-acetyltransferase
MPADITESFAELGRQAAARLTALDPLLPASVELPAAADPVATADPAVAADPAVTAAPAAGCGTLFTAAGSDGVVNAIGQCEHRFHEPESPSLTWGNARQFTLRPVLGGTEAGPALDDLLGQWRDHLATIAETDDEDSAAVVRWPTRDIEGIRALQRHGLFPQSVIAARITPEGQRKSIPSAPAGVSVRRAGPADADAVAGLSLDLVRYEAHFGSLHLRPWTETVLHKEATDLLAAPHPWAWIAEHDGGPVGLLTATRPEGAAWIAPIVRLAPAAYLGEMFVRSAERGSGVAAVLASRFNDAAATVGVAVTLLHYGQVNPLSGPFWSRQGYRPLWTTWEARPARTLR